MASHDGENEERGSFLAKFRSLSGKNAGPGKKVASMRKNSEVVAALKKLEIAAVKYPNFFAKLTNTTPRSTSKELHYCTFTSDDHESKKIET
ncbi:hypothetical protein ON010_g10665 [Phytophthora cinnamomi]|nr:hypothetical protein ON010_g10665 [Phytophthora cinnamomi]